MHRRDPDAAGLRPIRQHSPVEVDPAPFTATAVAAVGVEHGDLAGDGAVADAARAPQRPTAQRAVRAWRNRRA
jgi:hypothetical protein